MSKFTITRADLADTCSYGQQRVRTLLQHPTKLTFVTKPGVTEGAGRHIEHFSIADLFPRLRERGATEEMLEKLIALDQQRRNAFE